MSIYGVAARSSDTKVVENVRFIARKSQIAQVVV